MWQLHLDITSKQNYQPLLRVIPLQRYTFYQEVNIEQESVWLEQDSVFSVSLLDKHISRSTYQVMSK